MVAVTEPRKRGNIPYPNQVPEEVKEPKRVPENKPVPVPV
jgi:hypothetical protein